MSEILKQFLRPFNQFFDDNAITEIMINKPGVVWIDKCGQQSSIVMGDFTYEYLRRLSEYVATHNNQTINEVNPLLSGHLPNGCRIQIVIPPASKTGCVVIAIRRYKMLSMKLNQYDFSRVNHSDALHDNLATNYKNCGYCRFLEMAIQLNQSILVIGGTSTGKTTFINACIAQMGDNQRLAIIEDALEIIAPHDNIVRLLYSRNNQGASGVTAEKLLEASLRLNPDRIILGELRGSEATSFLRAIGTGHPGSITSIHADSPDQAFEQLALMVMQSGISLRFDDVIRYVKSLIKIIVELKTDVAGNRYISRIHFDHSH